MVVEVRGLYIGVGATLLTCLDAIIWIARV